MKVLVLGGSGMLGHKLLQRFGKRFDVLTTIRTDKSEFEQYKLLKSENIFENIDLTDFDRTDKIISSIKPDVIVNAAGVTKQHQKLTGSQNVWKLNSELPQRLAKISAEFDIRLICISTDCVFDGKKGNYSENDVPNAVDVYGQSKIAGEVTAENCLTVRTSIIGRELKSFESLLEWFFANQNKTVKGYTNAVFSGFPTIIFADILADIIEHKRELAGIYHIAANPINKFDLLGLIKKYYNLSVEIEPFDDFKIDRSLNGEKFKEETNFAPLDWETMIQRMSADNFPYSKFSNENI